MIAVPMPPWIRGMCSWSTYVRWPGRDTRFMPLITGLRWSVYLSVTVIASFGRPSPGGTSSNPSM